jgi:hypothetical protein
MPVGAMGEGRGDLRQTLGEDLPRAGGIGADEATDLDVQVDGEPRPGQVAECALVAAVDAIARFAADGTTHVRRLRDGADGDAVVAEEKRRDME